MLTARKSQDGSDVADEDVNGASSGLSVNEREVQSRGAMGTAGRNAMKRRQRTLMMLQGTAGAAVNATELDAYGSPLEQSKSAVNTPMISVDATTKATASRQWSTLSMLTHRGKLKIMKKLSRPTSSSSERNVWSNGRIVHAEASFDNDNDGTGTVDDCEAQSRVTNQLETDTVALLKRDGVHAHQGPSAAAAANGRAPRGAGWRRRGVQVAPAEATVAEGREDSATCSDSSTAVVPLAIADHEVGALDHAGRQSRAHDEHAEAVPAKGFETDAGQRAGLGGVRPARSNVRAHLNRLELLFHDFQARKKAARLAGHTLLHYFPFFSALTHRIEGDFGTGYASFFVFSRFILLLNVLTSLLYSAFVVLPQAIHFDYARNITEPFRISSLITASSAMGQSWAFFGAYSPSLPPHYNMALAYLLVCYASLALCCLLIARSIRSAWDPSVPSAFASLVRSTSSHSYKFTHNVLCAWDFTLTSAQAVTLLQMGITENLRDQLAECDQRNRIRSRSPHQIRSIRLTRLFFWCLTLLIIVAGACAVYFLIQVGAMDS